MKAMPAPPTACGPQIPLEEVAPDRCKCGAMKDAEDRLCQECLRASILPQDLVRLVEATRLLMEVMDSLPGASTPSVDLSTPEFT